MSTAAAEQETKWWNGGRSPFNASYGKVMMWYFLMSDAFTFGAFLISYATLRFSLNDWVDANHVFNAFPFCRPSKFAIGFRKFNDIYFDLQFCYNGFGSA